MLKILILQYMTKVRYRQKIDKKSEMYLNINNLE